MLNTSKINIQHKRFTSPGQEAGTHPGKRSKRVQEVRYGAKKSQRSATPFGNIVRGKEREGSAGGENK